MGPLAANTPPPIPVNLPGRDGETPRTEEIHRPGLRGDAQTALLPLWARACESRTGPTDRPGLFHDPLAQSLTQVMRRHEARILGSLQCRAHRATQAGLAIRTLVFDRHLMDWQRRRAPGLVVDLGVGLSTRPDRLSRQDCPPHAGDAGLARTRWLGIDLPDVLSLRARLFGQLGTDDLFTPLAADLTDPADVRQLIAQIRRVAGIATSDTGPGRTKASPPEPICFVAEGVLMYLPRRAAMTLLLELAEAFPRAEMIADVLAPWQVAAQRCHDTLGLTEGRYRWGLQRPGKVLPKRTGWRVARACHFASAADHIDPNHARALRVACQQLPLPYRALTRLIRPILGDHAMLRLQAPHAADSPINPTPGNRST